MTDSQSEILAEIRSLQASLAEFREETHTDLRFVKSQLRTLEYGVLTIAQKLLAQSEVEEIRAKMAVNG